MDDHAILRTCSTKSLADTVAGELIALPNDQGVPDLAIVLSQMDDGTTHLALLRAADPAYSKPCTTKMLDDESCVSFGRAWIFELCSEADRAGTRYLKTAGCWTVEGEQVGLHFGPGQQGVRAVTISLNTWQPMPLREGHATGGPKWRIWGSPAVRADQRGAPLFEFDADDVEHP